MSSAGASEIERLVGEWLVLKCCGSTAVRVERVRLKTSIYIGTVGFPHAFVRSDANDVCLERALVTCRLKTGARGN